MLDDMRDAVAGDEPPGLADAYRLPIVRSVMPAVVVVSLGLGSLFSLGVVFVRDVLGATDAEFGVLIVLFGTGAAIGLGALSRVGRFDRVEAVRVGTLVQGVTIAVMSLSPSIGPAFLGAVAFGGATAFALAAGMTVLQDELDGNDRVLAFAAFHTVIRAGLALAAIGAGVAADLLDNVGSLEPSRVVLIGAGTVVVIGSALVARRGSVEPVR
jgi:predicted MFS family arabinose efflux permease